MRYEISRQRSGVGGMIAKGYRWLKVGIGYLIAYGILFWIFLMAVKVVVALLRFIGFTI